MVIFPNAEKLRKQTRTVTSNTCINKEKKLFPHSEYLFRNVGGEYSTGDCFRGTLF